MPIRKVICKQTTECSGGFRGTSPARTPNPLRPKFISIHAVFHKICQNHMLASPPEGWHPILWGILDPPLEWLVDLCPLCAYSLCSLHMLPPCVPPCVSSYVPSLFAVLQSSTPTPYVPLYPLFPPYVRNVTFLYPPCSPMCPVAPPFTPPISQPMSSLYPQYPPV